MSDWRQQAECLGVDPALFFAERGDDTAMAKWICSGCPVRDTCLQEAIDNLEQFGIWGGYSPRERRAISNGETVDERTLVAVCGTRGGYQRHRRNGEESCDKCRAAEALYQRELKGRVA